MKGEPDEEKLALLEIEQALLGSLLFDANAISLIEVPLHQTHFVEPFHGRLWQLMQEMAAADHVIDPLTLRARVGDDPAFEDLGGMSYFAALVDHAPSSATVNDYAAILVQKWQSKEIAALLAQTSFIANPTEKMAEIRAQLDRIESFDTAKEDFRSAEAAVGAALDQMKQGAASGRPLGLQTGIGSFNQRVGGFVPGDLIVLAAPPSMAKTLTGRGLLYSAAVLSPQFDFGYYSLEMTDFQMGCRTLSEIAFKAGVKIPYNQFRFPTDKMVEDLEAFRYQIATNFFVSDKPRRTIDDLERSIRRRARGGRLKAVVIDHLQRITIVGKQFDPIADICMRLKNLAIELGITIILLSQMNREIFRRENKRPLISDLRQSGAIEAEADVVCFPWRQYQMLKDEMPVKTIEVADWEYKREKAKTVLEMIYGKVRMGETGTDELWANPAYDSFADKEPGDPTFDW